MIFLSEEPWLLGRGPVSKHEMELSSDVAFHSMHIVDFYEVGRSGSFLSRGVGRYSYFNDIEDSTGPGGRLHLNRRKW